MKNENLLFRVLKIIAWIGIFISPFLIGIVLSVIIYLFFNKGFWGILFALLTSLLFLFFGIIFAIKKSKETGSIEFLSQIRASPELDHLKIENEENE